MRLFDRGSQGAELAAHGEVLLRCGINVFDEMQQGLRSLEHLSDPNFGEVRLGCTDIILHSLVSPIVRKFSARYPGVQLDIRLTNPGEHQIQELREIDLLMTRATGQQDDFHSEVLFDEPFVVVVGAHSELARKRRIVLTDIIKGNWVFPPYDSAPGALVAEVLRANGFFTAEAIGQNHSHSAHSVAHCKRRICWNSPDVGRGIERAPSRLEGFAAKSPGPRLSAEIVFLRNRTLSPAVQSFINCAREVAKSQVRVP